MRQALLVCSLVAVAGLATAAAAPLFFSSFVSAPAGIAVPERAVALPDVRYDPLLPLPQRHIGGTFGPTVDDMLSGQRVITNEVEMKQIWAALFVEPYDAAQFDFAATFVVWMGGNSMQLGSFGISSVEQVDAEWSDLLGFGGSPTDVDPFLAVTSTTFFPGAFPQDPPPSTFRVSAVLVPRALLDDVVFHRTAIFAP